MFFTQRKLKINALKEIMLKTSKLEIFKLCLPCSCLINSYNALFGLGDYTSGLDWLRSKKNT